MAVFHQPIGLLVLLSLTCLGTFVNGNERLAAAIPSNCSGTTPLQALPGHGWDSLRDEELLQLFRIEYAECELTPEGFLIPDGFEVNVVKESNIQTSTEVFQGMQSYTDITSRGFKVGGGIDLTAIGIPVDIRGSYEQNYRDVKRNMITLKSIVARASMSYTAYKVSITPMLKFNKVVQSQFQNVLTAIDEEKDNRADALLELMVRDYGTHYSNAINAGATIVQESYVNATWSKSTEQHETELRAAAGVSFSMLNIGGDFGTSTGETQQYVDEFMKYRKLTKTDSRGGKPMPTSAQEWKSGIMSNLVAIDRSGYLLSALITQERFPEASPKHLESLQSKLNDVIQKYGQLNAYKGCMDVRSPNFDYRANMPSTCSQDRTEFCFGGIYRTCSPISAPPPDLPDPCVSLTYKNSLSGSESCSQEYESTLLYEWNEDGKVKKLECGEVCYGWWIFKTCKNECHDKEHKIPVKLATYVCLPKKSKRAKCGQSYLLGGAYTNTAQNSQPDKPSCPAGFNDVRLTQTTFVCVALKDDTVSNYMLFGGFFTCKRGNPLVEGSDTKSCPEAYKHEVIAVEDGCQISYCYKFYQTPANYKDTDAIQPPFSDVSSRLFEDTGSSATGVIVAVVVTIALLGIVAGVSVYFYKTKNLNVRHFPDWVRQQKYKYFNN